MVFCGRAYIACSRYTRVRVSERFYRAHVHSRARARLLEIIALVSHWFIHAVLKQPHVIRDYHPY